MLDVKGNSFNAEQKAYIRKYAAGLLLAWAGPAVVGHITPDTMDGFEPPEGLFPENDTEDTDTYEGASEVEKLLDDWLDEIIVLAGYQNLDEVVHRLANTDTVYDKYPLMKDDEEPPATKVPKASRSDS